MLVDNTAIIDISKKIAADTAVWPGDIAVSIETKQTIDAGDMVNLTTLTFSAHTASHADAPYHVADQDLSIDQVDLLPYWGMAQIVTTQKKAGPLLPDDFSMYDLTLAPRLLVRTPAGSYAYNQFPEAIPYPEPALSNYLSECGIILYGTDAPSMDDLDSATLPGHQAMVKNKIAILEGLDLSLAGDGLYELCALPLKIAGGDGSPVRAALRRLT
jgi:arylformamidase